MTELTQEEVQALEDTVSAEIDMIEVELGNYQNAVSTATIKSLSIAEQTGRIELLTRIHNKVGKRDQARYRDYLNKVTNGTVSAEVTKGKDGSPLLHLTKGKTFEANFAIMPSLGLWYDYKTEKTPEVKTQLDKLIALKKSAEKIEGIDDAIINAIVTQANRIILEEAKTKEIKLMGEVSKDFVNDAELSALHTEANELNATI